MENVIKLNECITDFDKLEKLDCIHGVQIKIYSDTHDLLIYDNRDEVMDDDTIFGLWVECGEKTIMMNVPIDELELFASSVLKHIEIVRQSYGEQIKKQYNMGGFV